MVQIKTIVKLMLCIAAVIFSIALLDKPVFAGYCCMTECHNVNEEVQVSFSCNGTQCIAILPMYTVCDWVWCDSPRQSDFCGICYIKAADLEPITVASFYSGALI